MLVPYSGSISKHHKQFQLGGFKISFPASFFTTRCPTKFSQRKKVFARKQINLKFNKKFLLFGAKESKYLNLEVKTNDAKAFYLKTAFLALIDIFYSGSFG